MHTGSPMLNYCIACGGKYSVRHNYISAFAASFRASSGRYKEGYVKFISRQ